MDINKATREQLEKAGQIDGERARYLIQQRERSGGFASWEDVKQARSYEDGMVERLQAAGFSLEAPVRHTHGRRRSDRQERGSRTADASSGSGHLLNRASAAELEATHMIDGERAQRLIDARQRIGELSSWDDVKNVEGFDDGLVERLKQSGFRVGE